MHPDLRYLVLDVVHDVVEFQKHRHLTDPVVLLTQFLQLPVDVLNEFFVRLKMHGLNGTIHDKNFLGMDSMGQRTYNIRKITPSSKQKDQDFG